MNQPDKAEVKGRKERILQEHVGFSTPRKGVEMENYVSSPMSMKHVVDPGAKTENVSSTPTEIKKRKVLF